VDAPCAVTADRDALFRQYHIRSWDVEDQLLAHFDRPGPRLIRLVGEPGSGRRYAVEAAAARASLNGHLTISVELDLRTAPVNQRFDAFIDSLHAATPHRHLLRTMAEALAIDVSAPLSGGAATALQVASTLSVPVLSALLRAAQHRPSPRRAPLTPDFAVERLLHQLCSDRRLFVAVEEETLPDPILVSLREVTRDASMIVVLIATPAFTPRLLVENVETLTLPSLTNDDVAVWCNRMYGDKVPRGLSTALFRYGLGQPGRMVGCLLEIEQDWARYVGEEDEDGPRLRLEEPAVARLLAPPATWKLIEDEPWPGARELLTMCVVSGPLVPIGTVLDALGATTLAERDALIERVDRTWGGDAVDPTLVERGLRSHGLGGHGTDEWVYEWRDPAERAALEGILRETLQPAAEKLADVLALRAAPAPSLAAGAFAVRVFRAAGRDEDATRVALGVQWFVDRESASLLESHVTVELAARPQLATVLASAMLEDASRLSALAQVALVRALLAASTQLLPATMLSLALRRAELYETLGEYADALAEFQTLLPRVRRAVGEAEPLVFQVRGAIARLTGERGKTGDVEDAREQLERLLADVNRVLPAEHPVVLSTHYALASWTAIAGDPGAARDLGATLLTVAERVWDAENPNLLAIRHAQACLTGEAGDSATARSILAALLSVAERVLHPEHPLVLEMRQDHAYWTAKAGDPATARNHLAALVPVAARVMGAEHPKVLVARRNHLRLMGETGDPAMARDLLAALLPVMERTFGAEHLMVLETHLWHARWTGEAGDPATARDRFAALLPAQSKAYGAEHPLALNTRLWHARWTGEAGDPATARDLGAALLPVMEQVLGAEHPDVLDTRLWHARWTGEAGDPATARDLFATLLPVMEQVLGVEHPAVLGTRLWHASLTGETGDPAMARDLLAELRPVVERVLGAEHPELLDTRLWHARWTGEAGDPATARDLCAALLPVMEQILGADHPEVFNSHLWHARWTGEAGDPATARDLFAALLPALIKAYGAEHPLVLITRLSFARFVGEAGDLPACLALARALSYDLNQVSVRHTTLIEDTQTLIAKFERRSGPPPG